MHLLICNSNMFIPIVLTTVLNNSDQRYLIYVDIPSIYMFFDKLNLPENCNLLKYPHYINWKNANKAKQFIWNQLEHIDIKSITFYHTAYGELATWLISKYSRNTTIYFQSPFPSFCFKKRISLKALKLFLVYKIIYNTDIIPMDSGNNTLPSISPKFFKKNNVINKNAMVDNDLVCNYVNEKLNLNNNNSSILLVTGSNITAGFCDETDYGKIINSILSALGKDKFMVKCHPRFDDLLSIEKMLPAIPKYIPGNVILPLFDCYIGLCSALLIEAANVGKCSISILNLLNIDFKLKSVLKDSLEVRLKSGSTIYYPNSISELNDIVKRSCNNNITMI